MALTPEDGTGLANADSYASLVEMLAYATKFGISSWTDVSLTDTQREVSARLGTQWIDVRFGTRFIGEPLTTTQALAFPRQNACDQYGNAITGVPDLLKDATAEAAVIALADPLFARGIATTTSTTPTQTIKRVKAGSAEVEYQSSSTTVTTAVLSDLDKKVEFIEAMLKPLLGGFRGGLLQRS